MTRAVDWTDCDIIEQIPVKVSGGPVVRGTRILPDAIVNSFDMGESLQDLRQGFPSLSDTEIVSLINFAHTRRGQPTLWMRIWTTGLGCASTHIGSSQSVSSVGRD